MAELDLATVMAANDAWVRAPEGSEVVETAEYRLVRFPEGFANPLELQWLRSTRPVELVLGEVVARAAEFGLPEAYVFTKLGGPADFDEALVACGAQLVDTSDVLAIALASDFKAPDFPELEVRWRTTLEIARDANRVGTTVFDGSKARDEELARRAAADRETIAAGTGGSVVAYLGGAPVGVAAVVIADGVARLWGGGVLEARRGRGVYRALVAARMTYGAAHGATMALTQGRTATSSPILQRIGFVSYGRERAYRLPLE